MVGWMAVRFLILCGYSRLGCGLGVGLVRAAASLCLCSTQRNVDHEDDGEPLHSGEDKLASVSRGTGMCTGIHRMGEEIRL